LEFVFPEVFCLLSFGEGSEWGVKDSAGKGRYFHSSLLLIPLQVPKQLDSSGGSVLVTGRVVSFGSRMRLFLTD